MTLQLAPDMIQHAYYRNMLDIAKVEARYDAKYVGEFPGKTKDGWTADFPVAVFYRPVPTEGYTNRYFGLFERPGVPVMMITDADYVEGHVFSALQFDDGIVYSNCRHDFRKVNGFTIDGGWDYAHSSGGPLISVRVMDGKFEEVVNEYAGIRDNGS
jgi:hypothetical protein